MKILVIGGGIGGLSTALSLHQAGIGVRVFEAVPEISGLGVGINLQPNAVRELTELGLGADLAATGIATSTFAMFNKHGQKIWAEPRGLAAGYNWPQYSIHRGHLLMLLVRAVRERIGADHVVTGRHLAHFERDARGVTAHFIDRRTGKTLGSERGDALIGADGIHSAVRSQLYPDEDVHFDGMLMWRAAVEAPPFLDGKTHVIIGHQGQRFIAYPMTPSKNGKALINWIAELRVGGNAPPRADWNKRADKSAFAPAFANWNFPWLDIPALIAATETVYEFPKVDRDPVAQYSFGRVALLGDAAHPMLPTGSQAGTQAVIDGRYLARALLMEPDIEAALKNYDSERNPLMSEITLRNRKLGPELAMQIAEERAPHGFNDIRDVLSAAEMENFSQSFKKLAGFERDHINARPSILPEIPLGAPKN